jgi:CDP-diacylglycerol---glycerol-3-phosphate 3-phosphatidyltransferase
MNKERILNLPNTLAFARALLAPLIFFILIGSGGFVKSGIDISWVNYFAALFFVIAGVTDFFDGFIAREWNESTKLGSIIDPLADKMLMLAGFLGLMYLGRADVWAIFLILTREFFITGLRVAAVSEGKNVSASVYGKIKTLFQLIAIGFLIMQWPYGTLLLWVAVALTLYSGYEYTRDYFKD